MLPPKPLPPPSFKTLISHLLVSTIACLPQPKLPQFSLLADQCNSMQQLKQIHGQMVITGRICDNYAASRILSFAALSDSGDLQYASELFNSIQEPNSFMWNTLIRAYAGSVNPREALFLYIKMRRLCVTPGKHTFPFVLKACANLKSLNSCEQVHIHALKYGLDLDLHVVNGLIRGYSVSGGLIYARELFDEVSEKNLSIWTTMICGYAQNDCAGEAIGLFDRMTGEGLEPNGATMSSVLSACAQSGCLELGQKIHAIMEEKGIEFGVILGTALVNMYSRNGAILEAKKCFDNMTQKNIVTWNAMICGLAVHGHAKEAIGFFKKLEDEKVRPNEITLVGILSACCHAGFYEFGQEIFHSMTRGYGIKRTIEHYGCMVDLLGRAGKLQEAEELIRNMDVEADVVIWGTLLSACNNHGDVDVAERAMMQILRLDPNNHGVYVVLSNLYAEAGRWEDVVNLRKLMKQESLKKTPGWSFIEYGA